MSKNEGKGSAHGQENTNTSSFLFVILILIGIIYFAAPKQAEMKSKINEWRAWIEGSGVSGRPATERAQLRGEQNLARPAAKADRTPAIDESSANKSEPVDKLTVDDRKNLDVLVNKFF